MHIGLSLYRIAHYFSPCSHAFSPTSQSRKPARLVMFAFIYFIDAAAYMSTNNAAPMPTRPPDPWDVFIGLLIITVAVNCY